MASEESFDPHATIRTDAKATLRAKMRAVRKALPRDARAARSDAIASQVIELPAFESARVVLAYSAMGSEVSVAAVIDAARAHQKVVALTRVEPGASQLSVHAVPNDDDLELSAMGYRQPRADAPAVALESVDLVLVPALAVDERGHRLGWGKGYYDRLLPTLRRATTVAVAYDFQLLGELPTSPWDVPVQVIVTDRRVLAVSHG